MWPNGSATAILAVIGTLFGVPAFIWNIIKLYSERRKLGVFTTIGRSLQNKPTLVFNLTNMGRRPIILTQIGIAKKRKKVFAIDDVIWIYPSRWPKTLQEANAETIFPDDEHIVWAIPKKISDQVGNNKLGLLSLICAENYRYFFVIDSLDKR